MAPLLEDPRYRQTWNAFSQNAEQATETAATSIWNFQHRYLNPCFASIGTSLEQCTGKCFPDREERARRRNTGRTRGRAELSFDFYDDWDEDDGGRSGGLLGGWGNDELDRLLAGSGSNSGGSKSVDRAPKRKRGMSYGTRAGRRPSLEPDPTIIPSTNTLGFLGRLPFKFGGTLRYKPSAADLQDHPGASREEHREEEGEPLMSDDYSEEEGGKAPGHRRQRSSTASSGETNNSFRSRGDLFPSDGEDDAVPIDDEFAMVLERRMTGDDRGSGKSLSSKGKRPAGSRTASRTMSRTTNSSSRPNLSVHRTGSGTSLAIKADSETPDMVEAPSLTDLQAEEERITREEDEEVERKRQAAIKLAVERGLHANGLTADTTTETKSEVEVPLTNHTATNEAETNEADAVESSSMPPPEVVKQNSAPSAQPSKNFVPARLPHFG